PEHGERALLCKEIHSTAQTARGSREATMTRQRSSYLLIVALQVAWTSLLLGAPAHAGKPPAIRTAGDVLDMTRGATDASVAVRSLAGDLIVDTATSGAKRVLIELRARPILDRRAGAAGNSKVARNARAAEVMAQQARLAEDLEAIHSALKYK